MTGILATITHMLSHDMEAKDTEIRKHTYGNFDR